MKSNKKLDIEKDTKELKDSNNWFAVVSIFLFFSLIVMASVNNKITYSAGSGEYVCVGNYPNLSGGNMCCPDDYSFFDSDINRCYKINYAASGLVINDDRSCTHSMGTLEECWADALPATEVELITVPSCKSAIYDGKVHTLIESNIGVYLINGSSNGGTATEAGSHTFELQLVRTDTQKWDDRTTGTKTLTCEILKADVTGLGITSYNFGDDGNLSVTVTEPEPCGAKIIVDINGLTIDDDQAGWAEKPVSKAGTYNFEYEKTADIYSGSIKYLISDSNCNSSTVSKSVSGGNSSTKVASQPKCTTEVVYDGTEQNLVSGTGYTVSNGGKAITAGEHSFTATLASGYEWWDGTTDDKTLTCEILKADVTGLGITSYNFGDDGNLSVTVTEPAPCGAKIIVDINGLTVDDDQAGWAEKPVSKAGTYNFEYEKTADIYSGSIKYLISDSNCNSSTVSKSVSGTFTSSSRPSSSNSSSSSSSSSKPSSSSISSNSSSSDNSSSSSFPSGSGNTSSGDKITPIYGISLSSSELVINEEAILSFGSSVDGKVTLYNGNNKIITLSSTSSDLLANDLREFKIKGLSKGETTVRLVFEPTDSDKYNGFEKTYTIVVNDSNNSGNENVDTNAPTGNIMLFMVWIIGLGALGYSYYGFKSGKFN